MDLTYTHSDGSVTGLRAAQIPSKPFEPIRFEGFDVRLFLKAPPEDPAVQERHEIIRREHALQEAQWKKASNVFLTVYRETLKACRDQEQKDAVNALYVRFLTKRAEITTKKKAEITADVEKLTEQLIATNIFKDNYPILTDEQIEAQMVDLS